MEAGLLPPGGEVNFNLNATPATLACLIWAGRSFCSPSQVIFGYTGKSPLRLQNLMIEVSNLTKRYAGRTAVSDISFTVARGEIVGLLGPNGAGKSTTMRILSCFMPATSGTARVAGFDVFHQSDGGAPPHRLHAGKQSAVSRNARARISEIPRAAQGPRLAALARARRRR